MIGRREKLQVFPVRPAQLVIIASVRAHGVRTPFSICRTSSIRLPCLYYFFLAVVVIRYETAATARWALLFIVRAFFNDTITVAVWTGFHVRLMGLLPHPCDYIRWRFVDPAVAAEFAKEFEI